MAPGECRTRGCIGPRGVAPIGCINCDQFMHWECFKDKILKRHNLPLALSTAKRPPKKGKKAAKEGKGARREAHHFGTLVILILNCRVSGFNLRTKRFENSGVTTRKWNVLNVLRPVWMTIWTRKRTTTHQLEWLMNWIQIWAVIEIRLDSEEYALDDRWYDQGNFSRHAWVSLLIWRIKLSQLVQMACMKIRVRNQLKIRMMCVESVEDYNDICGNGTTRNYSTK